MSSTPPTDEKQQFIVTIQEWVVFDSAIQKHKEEIKSIQDKKDVAQGKIVEYLEKQKIENVTININDGYLKYVEQSTTQPLTLQTLRSLLLEYFKDEKKTDECFQFIKNKRNVKKNRSIKRYFT